MAITALATATMTRPGRLPRRPSATTKRFVTTLPPSSPAIGSRFRMPHHRLTNIRSLAASVTGLLAGSHGFDHHDRDRDRDPDQRAARLDQDRLARREHEARDREPTHAPQPYLRVDVVHAQGEGVPELVDEERDRHHHDPLEDADAGPGPQANDQGDQQEVDPDRDREAEEAGIRRPGSEGVTKEPWRRDLTVAPGCGARSG